MSMKSMDLQTLIPRSTDVGRVQHLQNQESQISQHQEAMRANERARQQMTQVQVPRRAEGPRIGPDQRRRRRPSPKPSASPGALSKGPVEPIPDPHRGKKLDVTL